MARNPGNGGRGKNRNNNNSNFIRRNDRIRAREIRLIGPSGSQIGIVSRDEGLALAKQAGLDLVEISANARPPVCRILDFGKYMYELSKKQKDNKSSTSRVKEVKFRVRIEQHDYMTKLRRAEAFLFKGSKLKLSLMFRGREMEHRELGFDVIKRAIEDLVHVGVADAPPKMAGRNLGTTMSPLAENKRKLVYNESKAALDAHDDDEGDADDGEDYNNEE